MRFEFIETTVVFKPDVRIDCDYEAPLGCLLKQTETNVTLNNKELLQSLRYSFYDTKTKEKTYSFFLTQKQYRILIQELKTLPFAIQSINNFLITP